ncbi:DNA repair protein RAD51 homolog 2-like isoform X2 [Lineus longissimus]
MMLSALAGLPQELGGLGGSVLYIDTESAFSAERLVEMAQTRHPFLFSSEESLIRLTSNVHVCVESTCGTLLKRLERLEEDVIAKNVKLIVLDSIASLVRKEFDGRNSKNMTERTNLLAKEAAILKYIAEEFMIPIVVTNQITTRFGVPKEVKLNNPEDETSSVNLEGEGGYVTAALGNTWSHCVNTRFIVQYLDGPRRQILIAKSPVAPFAAFIYRIQSSGLVLEEDSGDGYDGTDPGLQKIRVRTSINQTAFEY